MKRIFTLIAVAKNEGPYLWEWVAHHLAVGFDNILVYQNDSDDLTHEILRQLQALGVVKYFYNRAPNGSHQVRAYMRAANEECYKNSDYVMALDTDEFLVINTPTGNVRDFVDQVDDFDAALINWVNFNSSGHKELCQFNSAVPELTLQRFVYGEKYKTKLHPYKALLRPEKFIRPGIHRPHPLDVENGTQKIINGSNIHFPDFKIDQYRSTNPAVTPLAQINHYIIRDAKSFALKSHRGSAHRPHRLIDLRYFQARAPERAYVRRPDEMMVKRTIAKMVELDIMCNRRLSKLTASSIERHNARFEELKSQNDPIFELYENCVAYLDENSGRFAKTNKEMLLAKNLIKNVGLDEPLEGLKTRELEHEE